MTTLSASSTPPVPSGLLRRSELRSLGRHPWRLALSVLGIALGVAVVVSIDLANQSATRAFDLSTETLTGRATHQITAGSGGLPDGTFRDVVLRTDAADAGPGQPVAAAPVVEGVVSAPLPGDAGTLTLQVLGVDPFREAPFRPYLEGLGGLGGGEGDLLGPFLTRPAAGVLSAATAAELGVSPGETFPVLVDGVERPVELVGTLEPGDESSRRALASLLVMDIASAQELLDRVGRLDRIDRIGPPEPGRADPGGGGALEGLVAVLPPDARVQTAAARSNATEQMTRAFRLNLTALSLLALVCGMFLIYNTMTFSVVQRRGAIGVLRALGVTRREVFRMVLLEALVLGIAGTALGLGLGIVLARGLVDLVTQTINDLYFSLTVRTLAVPVWSVVKGVALGVGATLAAALPPALEATSAPPRVAQSRAAVESKARRGVPRAGLAGAGLFALGLALLAVPTESLLVAFAGLFAIVLGCALAVPVATVALMALLRPLAAAAMGLVGQRILGKMAARGVTASLSRTGVAMAALVVAVAVTVGVATMVASFRGTVVRWLDVTLRADVYLSPAAPSARPQGVTLDPRVPEVVAADPAVERINRLRTARVPVVASHTDGAEATDATDAGSPVLLLAIDTDDRGRRSFQLVEGRFEATWSAVDEAGAVLVSEPYAYRHRLEVGDTVRLVTDAGPRDFPVSGVYTDYGSDQGAILTSLATYRAHWDDRRLSALSVFAAPEADVDALVARLRRATGDVQQLQIRSNRALRQTSLEIFDRTFRITDVLRLLVGLVAFVGVLSALMALQLERSRELGVLRANGMTPGQVGTMVTAQTGLMGLASGLLALPVGLVLAAVMIHVINKRSFGWTLDMALPPSVLLQALLLALAAALLAGLYPAWKMARTSPAVALREE